MYGNKRDELVKELSIMNMIGMYNIKEFWDSLPQELKDDVFSVMKSYLKGSTLRALNDKDDRSNTNDGHIYEYLDSTQDEPFVKLRRKGDKY